MPQEVDIRLRRGTKAQLNTIVLGSGEIGYTYDTNEIYVGWAESNKLIGGAKVGPSGDRLSYNTTGASGALWVDTSEANKLYAYHPVSGWIAAGITDLADMLGNLDDISDGTTYGRVLQTELTAGKVNRLDDGTYSVTASGLYAHVNDDTIHRVINDSSTSTTDLWSASKIRSEIDFAKQGLDTKDSVAAATTVSGAIATAYENGDTLDGYTLVTGDRILIKDQGVENGIYVVNDTGAPTRAVDMPLGSGCANTYVWVEQGTVNADTAWVVTNDPPNDIIGTDALNWSLFTHATLQQAGSGLVSDANTLNVNPGSGIGIVNDEVVIIIDTITGGNVAGALQATDNGLGVLIDDYSIKENASQQLYVRRVDGGGFV